MAASPVSPDTIHLVEESYHRCQSEAFFQAFYQRLLTSHESFPAMFVGTDFQRQNKLLQHSIGLLFVYAKRANPAILERIAFRHSKGDLNIAPEHYPHFVDSLVGTMKLFDPKYSPELEAAWRQAVAPGIDFMISRYHGGRTPTT